MSTSKGNLGPVQHWTFIVALTFILAAASFESWHCGSDLESIRYGFNFIHWIAHTSLIALINHSNFPSNRYPVM